MNSLIYENIIKLSTDLKDQEALNQIRNIIFDEKSDTVCLTIKYYNQNLGLSKFIFEENPKDQHKFKI